MCNHRRSCAVTRPIREITGLLFVFGRGGPEATAEVRGPEGWGSGAAALLSRPWPLARLPLPRWLPAGESGRLVAHLSQPAPTCCTHLVNPPSPHTGCRGKGATAG